MSTEISNIDTRTLIDLRQQANYWKAQHARVAKREAIWKARSNKLEKAVKVQNIKIKELSTRVEELEIQVKRLRQQLFGRKTEKNRASGIDAFCDNDEVFSSEGKGRKRGKQKGAKGFGRKRYGDLPTEIIYHDLPEDMKQCKICKAPFIQIEAAEDSEEIHIEIRVIRRIHKRLRYSQGCNCKETPVITTAAPAAKLIPKGLFSTDFWVHILMEKYLFQRPLNRILETMKMEGLKVSQGTITGGLQKIGTLLQPLYTRILERNRTAEHWHMDETSWMVFAVVEGKTGYKWWLWVIVTEDTCGYILDPSRSADVPRNHLGENPQGIISADRYSAYKALGKDVRIAFCWSHVRRDFVRIRDGHKKLRVWAEIWIEKIGKLYKLNEERLKVIKNEEKFHVADQALREALGLMKLTYEKELGEDRLHPAKRKVLNSLCKHWHGLILFADNPNIPMDNNLSERQLRNPVVGRKNYYGCSSLWSGTLTAGAFTVFQTLLLNDINPKRFLKYYFEACSNNQGKPPENIDDYLPWNMSNELKAACGGKSPP